MKNLVEVKYNKIFTTSNIVGEEFGIAHNEVLKKISGLASEIIPAEFKEMFTESTYINSQKREYKNYHLNRDGYMFLVMNISTKKAHEKKLAFIKAFNLMEVAIIKSQTNKQDIEWNSSRALGKSARAEETDAIKKFVEYATNQGSKNAKFYYSNITNASYKALGLMTQRHPKIRDQMNIYELAQLMLAEKLATDKLAQYMELGRHYKDIYQSVKQDLIDFSNAVRLN